MAWCTTAEVLSITGLTVSQDNVDAAQYVIEIFADTTEESDDYISSKNLRLLKLATAYQAAWLTSNPDLYTKKDVEAFNMDGLSVTYRNENSPILAPMAKRALARLSWKRNRSIYLRRPDGRLNYVPPTLNTTNADLDDRRTDWRPLDY